MAKQNKIYKPKPVSGFPEWLPEYRAVEQCWLDKIRAVFESYGYCSIETPAVEELEVIAAKGEDVDKEIYVLERLQADPDEKKDARLALHFDQTVPLARYVAQHFADLTFPFKRYQMQKVWRGERPQMGRMREFYQCDIDVINVDSLPIHFDAEVAAICYEALEALDMGRVQLRVSNRKILMGFLESLNVPDKKTNGETTVKLSDETKAEIIRDIDKLEKIGKKVLLSRLEQTLLVVGELGFNFQTFIEPFLNLAETKIKPGANILELFQNNSEIDSSNEMLREGIEELQFVLDQLAHLPEHAVVADLSIVRGLDYYTGTVYETQLLDVPEFVGSVCSGGRYDDLAGSYINKHLPGVGISIGFTRLFDVLRQAGKIEPGLKSPADVLVVLPSEERRDEAAQAARTLRERGVKVELYHAPQKVGKQIAYAEKKGIPHVWFPPFEDGQAHEVKNMSTGKQMQADPKEWNPDE
ncbi:MAG TPA: histidine--tRNA ligase [Alphaproteobacteria bacterium]|nr:MAG: histidine--tRNA ligase [Rhodospirillales bacterium]HOO82815.1 histidine--tRNA ligase [Alphaproteobacteria bacterium]